ncbi:hypothetical protein GUJ93_ZPchr0216g11338 [Zizania palustris]|uniref:Uncharacterized protein n=1 Tax=Zizania palustris TaxID=103762 RepID=A0A8J5R6N5_ZIZPA|nr:hypothetical protein GUJ93_ZPchr0216g11338 [Zizania palustris]
MALPDALQGEANAAKRAARVRKPSKRYSGLEWAVIMHCHFDVYLSWGLSMAWLVNDGPLPSQKLPPPPSDIPMCSYLVAYGADHICGVFWSCMHRCMYNFTPSFHGRLRLIGLTDAERAAAGRGKGSILSSSVWTTSMELMVESRAGDDDVDKRGAAPCKKRRQRLMRRWEGLAGGGDKQAAAGGAAPAPPPPPPSSLPRRCARLVKEHRARFYIVRRCVTMLACWRDYHP